MRKIIDYDGYNEAEILEMYENGDVRTNVFQIENDEVIKQDTNIVFAAGTIVFTEEETNTINDYLSDLKALTEEKTAHWLTDGGIEDEWDDYVSAMDSMGLQDVVAAWQAAYDRYVEAQ